MITNDQDWNPKTWHEAIDEILRLTGQDLDCDEWFGDDQDEPTQ